MLWTPCSLSEGITVALDMLVDEYACIPLPFKKNFVLCVFTYVWIISNVLCCNLISQMLQIQVIYTEHLLYIEHVRAKVNVYVFPFCFGGTGV